MASAGRILIIPKGEYDSGAKYEMLDLVHYNGTSWLAKKTATGIEPSDANSEYWHKMFDINALVNVSENVTTKLLIRGNQLLFVKEVDDVETDSITIAELT